MVICLERGADLHIAQLMPLPFNVSRSSKSRLVFTFPVPAHLGSPGQMVVKWVSEYLLERSSSNKKKRNRKRNELFVAKFFRTLQTLKPDDFVFTALWILSGENISAVFMLHGTCNTLCLHTDG